MKHLDLFLTDAQLASEIARCVYCEEKPCTEACPADCSPADFLMAAKGGTPADLARSAALIMTKNPLGGVCGLVCPDRFCMAACSRKEFDGPIDIPQVQATIVQMAKRVPEAVIQEDQALLMYFDNASLMLGERPKSSALTMRRRGREGVAMQMTR